MNIKPRDSATLIILDNSFARPKILMGRRHAKHKFMPNLFVFPGGRVERHDHKTICHNSLHKVIENKISKYNKSAKALAVAALRETAEETGLHFGVKKNSEIIYALSPLKLIARAITPPIMPRRFDTWFFLIEKKHLAKDVGLANLPDNELQDIHWLTIRQAFKLDLPFITKTILGELEARLKSDPKFSPKTPIPFFHHAHKKFVKNMI